MPGGKDKDDYDKPTKEEILGYIYEYGLYALLGMAVGLVANMVIKAIIQ